MTSAYFGRVTDDRATEVAQNRALWGVLNERFTDAAANALWSRTEVVWGLFSVPDRLVGVLGDVADFHVVELACGTAYFSAWLTAAGAKRSLWTCPASSWRRLGVCRSDRSFLSSRRRSGFRCRAALRLGGQRARSRRMV